MKKIALIIYPEYAEFQIAHTLFLLTKLGNAKITTVSLDGETEDSVGGLTTQVDASLSDIDVMDYDLILIPGGDGIRHVLHEKVISETLKKCISSNIPIATVCGAAAFLTKANILKERRFTCLLETYEKNRTLFEKAIYTGNQLEKDELIITAKPTAFAELAIEIGKMLHLFKNEKQMDSFYSFCKGENE